MSSQGGIMHFIIKSIRRKYRNLRAKKRVKGSGTNTNLKAYRRRKLFLPAEIITEILSWLPVKSIQRLKCVCKPWFSIVEDRAFIHKHSMRVTDKIWVVEEGNGHIIRGVCQGVILEKYPNSNYRLRNPSTNRVLDLPDPHEKEVYHMRPCYISSTKTFKVVFPFANHKSNGNGIDFPFTCNLTWTPYWVINLFEGVFVFVLLPEIESEQLKREIVIFEVENEKVWRISIPHHILSSNWDGVNLINWAGKPSLCQRSGNNDELVHVWVVEDYKKQKWAKENIVIDLTSIKELSRDYTPYWFYDKKLDMHFQDEKYLRFDIVSKGVMRVDPPKIAGKKRQLRPTLMEFKGMKPITKTHN